MDLGKWPSQLFFEQGVTPSQLWEMTPFEFMHLFIKTKPQFELKTLAHLIVVNEKLRAQGKKPVIPDWFMPKVPSKRKKIGNGKPVNQQRDRRGR